MMNYVIVFKYGDNEPFALIVSEDQLILMAISRGLFKGYQKKNINIDNAIVLLMAHGEVSIIVTEEQARAILMLDKLHKNYKPHESLADLANALREKLDSLDDSETL